MTDNTATDRATLVVHRERDFLAEFLKRYWFAPPVALWRAIEAKALTSLDFPAPMLDFGCGDGMFTDAVFGKQRGIYGCDIASGELPSARDSGVYARGVQFADGHALPYRDNTFGSCYSNSVIEHIPDPQNVLPELARVLRPGGILVLTVPSNRFHSLLDGVRHAPSKEAAKAYEAHVDKLFAHHHYHDADEWRVLLQACGLRLTHAHYYVSPDAVSVWDRMNREYGIGGRSFFNLIASPRLRWLGYQSIIARQMPRRLMPTLRPLYESASPNDGGGMLVVGQKEF
ncbi:MAG: methyltransferase domain-containing protein [Chloroflexi bacterium]|nr:methyltransferase domain-containing protein [Chloroflexota bacterium]